LIVAVAACGAALLSPGTSLAATTERVSVDSLEEEGNGTSGDGALSADGRYVAFSSEASNLVPDDANGQFDAFVRDRVAGTTERVSLDSGEAEGDGPSYWVSISADGRYVAFQSDATDLVPDDTNARTDVFVRDRMLGTTERVSLSTSGSQGNGYSWTPNMSPDGRYVVFSSVASNLELSGDTNSAYDIFIRDRSLGTTERVSVDSAEVQSDADSLRPAVSEDGRYVAFTSAATNLVPGDSNAGLDVFVRDRVLETTERVSITSDETEAEAESLAPGISADGRYVVFESYATDMVPGDNNGAWDMFIRDRSLGTTERVSVDSAENEGDFGLASDSNPRVSDDGRLVLFSSHSTNLVPGDNNGQEDAFIRDRLAGTTQRVSVDSAGNEGDLASVSTVLAADTPLVAFASNATNLTPGDTNDAGDVFVRTLDLEPDTDLDGVLDIADNCPDIPNAGQENADADAWGNACDNCPTTSTPWEVPPGDGDCDYFTDADEATIGTNAADACGFTTGGSTPSEVWPPDLNPTDDINILDVLAFKPVFGASGPARYDIQVDGSIDILDVLKLKPVFNQACTP
jgi:Tol biopolymer transport system component